jgi:intracellular multiplication protein IcmQ
MQSWERILMNLPKQMISRPIYADEMDLQSLIRTKENKTNEAYVCMHVNQSDILPLPKDKVPIDKLGKSLLTLKDKSLRLDSIRYFVHQSGSYQYSRGRLIKSSSADE